MHRGVKEIDELMPSKEEFRQAISKLIFAKKLWSRDFRNSLIGLRHIYDWPEYKRLRYWAGWIFCIIDTNGDLLPCDRIDYSFGSLNCISMGGVRDAINMLPQFYCSGCGFCGALELNYLMHFRFGIISSICKIINS